MQQTGHLRITAALKFGNAAAQLPFLFPRGAEVVL